MGTMISDPLVGQVLGERYRVCENIARGGMAAVYRAEDTRLDRTVALKAMHPSLADDESFVSRFIGEAKSAARLSHPHVVSVFDQGSDAGVVFLTMEHLSGRTARDLLAEHGQLGAEEALALMQAVLSALGAAHQAGIVHRDVKPENVLVGNDGRIKVGDFGLARAIAAANHTRTSGLLIGTMAYLSPEQVQHGDADTRSDVYAAGILMFELLTGSQPFVGDTPIAVAYRHVNEEVPAPSSVVPGLPSEVDGLVRAATRREPDRRPADAAGMLALTTRVRERLGEGAAPAGDPRRVQQPQQSPRTPDTPQPAGQTQPARDAQAPRTQPVWSAASDTLVVPSADIVPGLSEESDPRPQADPWSRVAASLRRHRGWAVLAGALVLAMVAGGVAYHLGWGRWTEAPRLAGMTVEAASEKATRLGFAVDRREARFSNRVPPGSVIATEPQQGARIVHGGTITLVPSKGKRKVAVPDVSGQDPAPARQALRQADLKVGEDRDAYSASVPIGAVTGTEPTAGTKITVGSRVRLVISQGVQVPRVVGETRDQATTTLQGAGFAVAVVARVHDADAPAGVVLQQDPAAGGGARAGSTVDLTVSKGTQPVAIPSVVGMGADKARDILEQAGFEVKVRNLPVPGNRVRAQDPAAGTKHPPGTTVTVSAW